MSQLDLEWADLVLVMEAEHKGRLRDMFKGLHLPPIECLDIPDDYGFMDESLVTLIEDGTESDLNARFGIGSNANGPAQYRQSPGKE